MLHISLTAIGKTCWAEQNYDFIINERIKAAPGKIFRKSNEGKR